MNNVVCSLYAGLVVCRNQEDLDLFVQEVELMRKLRHRCTPRRLCRRCCMFETTATWRHPCWLHELPVSQHSMACSAALITVRSSRHLTFDPVMHCLLCSNIVDFIGAGEVRAGDVPGAFACEFIVQVRGGVILSSHMLLSDMPLAPPSSTAP